jgi:glycosyltransferase involved in cell wall biosynthesis
MRQVSTTFKFKSYITTGWYFQRYPKGFDKFPAAFYDEDIWKLTDEERALLAPDTRYETEIAQKLDIGYRAWNKGFMIEASAKTIESYHEAPSMADEYRFIRKYYGLVWATNILLLRLITFHNPFKELGAYLKSRDATKENIYKAHQEYTDYTSFQSPLVASKPKVSVIIPTLNRYKYLLDAIKDLEHQTLPIHELIVIDQSDKPDREFYNQFNIPIQLIVQEGRGQWLARNAAIKAATGEWLLFFDDDSRVESNWVEEHVKGVDFFKADISAGVSLSKVGDKIPENYAFFRWADQFDSGNALVHKRVFQKTGLFDMQFDRMRMGDGEFGLRAYLHGFKSISHPFAGRIHLKVNEGGLRQVGSWDAFRTGKMWAPMPIPSVTYYYRRYFSRLSIYMMLVQGIFRSAIPYKLKKYKFLLPLSLIFALLKSPLVIAQVYKSWKAASIMIAEGSKIEYI